MAVQVDFRLENVEQVLNNLGNFSAIIRKPENKRQIAKSAAAIVVQGIQSETPIGRKIHARWRKGAKVATYVPGNLQKSVQDLADRFPRYLKYTNVIVGPVYSRRSNGVNLGANKRNADGYYAHMIYGSAKAFGDKVSIRGAKKVEAQAVAAMKAAAQKVIEMAKGKTGF